MPRKKTGSIGAGREVGTERKNKKNSNIAMFYQPLQTFYASAAYAATQALYYNGSVAA